MSRNTICNRFWGAWLPVIGLCAIIFAQSCFPTPNIGISFALKDKFLHVGVYGLLAVLFFRGCWIFWPDWRSPWQILVVSVLFVVLYGVMDELHQSVVPFRHASGLDVLADAVGGGIGGLTALLFFSRSATPSKR